MSEDIAITVNGKELKVPRLAGGARVTYEMIVEIAGNATGADLVRGAAPLFTVTYRCYEPGEAPRTGTLVPRRELFLDSPTVFNVAHTSRA